MPSTKLSRTRRLCLRKFAVGDVHRHRVDAAVQRVIGRRALDRFHVRAPLRSASCCIAQCQYRKSLRTMPIVCSDGRHQRCKWHLTHCLSNEHIGADQRRLAEPGVAHDDDPIDHGAGAGPLSRGAADDLRRTRSAAVRRRVGDLRPRQRRGPGRGALRASRRAPHLPRAQRAGDGARGDRLREGAFPAADDGVHDVHRPRRDQPDHGGGDRARQPAAGAVAARRRVRLARSRPRAAAGRGFPRRRHLGQRLLQAGVALFRPHPRAVAAAHRVCRARSPC